MKIGLLLQDPQDSDPKESQSHTKQTKEYRIL